MAGGAAWTLEGKADQFETYQVMEGSTVRHYRARKIAFQISTPVNVTAIDTGAGEVGQTSGMLTFSVANLVKTRAVVGSSKFLCVEDETRKIQTAGRHYLRSQTWEYIGQAEEYNPETGVAL